MRPRVPSADEVYHAAMAMQPSGDAWQSYDGSIGNSHSVMHQFWYAIAIIIRALMAEIARSYDEFFCSTARDDLDLWREEYGLPDRCDPFGNDLCAKVRATGGTSLAYYEQIAADLGWVADIKWLKGTNPLYPGVHSTLLVTVDSEASEAGFAVHRFPDWILGVSHFGEPQPTRLTCTLDRIIPAHAAIILEVI